MARAPKAPAPAKGAAVFMAKPDEALEDAAEDAAEEPLDAALLVAAATLLEIDEAADAALLEAPATAPLTEDERDERAEAPEALAAEATEAADPVRAVAVPPAVVAAEQ